MAREQDESYQLLIGISKGTVFGRNLDFRLSITPQRNPQPGMQ